MQATTHLTQALHSAPHCCSILLRQQHGVLFFMKLLACCLVILLIFWAVRLCARVVL